MRDAKSKENKKRNLTVILFTTVTLHAFKEKDKPHVMILEGVYDFSVSNVKFLAK